MTGNKTFFFKVTLKATVVISDSWREAERLHFSLVALKDTVVNFDS